MLDFWASGAEGVTVLRVTLFVVVFHHALCFYFPLCPGALRILEDFAEELYVALRFAAETHPDSSALASKADLVRSITLRLKAEGPIRHLALGICNEHVEVLLLRKAAPLGLVLVGMISWVTPTLQLHSYRLNFLRLPWDLDLHGAHHFLDQSQL